MIRKIDFWRLLYFTKPARRHLCDACNTVFECHLCKVGKDHNVHHNTGVRYCLTCCAIGFRYYYSDYRGCGYPSDLAIFDMLTGEVLQHSRFKRYTRPKPKLSEDKARYSRRPNRRGILSKRPDLGKSPLKLPEVYYELTTIAKTRSK